jgi:DNA-binding NarL/FixJ family response regulator
MSKSDRIRVLVVDDHPVVCQGLAAIIRSQPDMSVAGQASNGVEAVQVFRRLRPDVTLMDLRMPELGGVEAIRAIREDYPESKFIVLTTYQGDEDIHKALSAGAQGYLLKGMSHATLIDAIRSVHASLRYLPTPVLETLANRPPGFELSSRELEILHLIVKGLSNKQIAKRLGIAEGTVKWHVNVISGRLEVHGRTQAAVAALSRGIVELWPA